VSVLFRRVFAGLLPLLVLSTSASFAVEGRPVQIWLLAGQSNAIGWSDDVSGLPPELQQPQPNVKIYTDTSGGWKDLGPGFGHPFGAEVTFGRDMAAALPKVDVRIVKANWLGSLYKDWRPPKTGGGSEGALYTKFIRFVQGALDSAPNAQIAGMLFMQGEADAYGPNGMKWSQAYENNLKLFINSLRKDLKSPNMAFVIGQITSSDAWVNHEIVRQAQSDVARTVPNTYMVVTDDLPLHDNMHYNTRGLMVLGNRFAKAAVRSLKAPAVNVRHTNVRK